MKARDHCSGLCSTSVSVKPLDVSDEMSGLFPAVLVELHAFTRYLLHFNLCQYENKGYV